MRFKGLMVLLLTFVIVSASGLLSACDNKTGVPTASPAVTAAIPEEVVDPLGKYEEPITLSTVFVSSSATEDAVAAYGTDETLENNRWTQLMKDKLNIDMDYTAVLDVSQYAEKVNIMIASGEVPDYLCQLPATTVKQMVDGGLLMPVRGLFDKWASDVNKTFHNVNRYFNWTTFNFNDDYYAIPMVGEDDVLDSTSVLWIRRDWLKNLELPNPQTPEDLDNVIKAFATQDPDKDGENDTIGLGLMGGDFLLTSSLGYFNCNGAHPQIWLEDGKGGLVKGIVQPEVKNALQKLRDMYAQKYIDFEFSVKGVPQLSEDIVNGKVGLFFGIHASPILYAFAEAKTTDPKADWTALPLPGAKASLPAPSNSTLGQNGLKGIAINVNCKHPEAVIKMMNVANTVDALGTAENKTYYVTNGNNFVTPVKYPHLPMSNLYMALSTSKMLEGMDMATARDTAIDEFYPPEDAAVLKKIFANETENIIYTLIKPFIDSQSPDGYPWHTIFGPEGSEHVLRLYWDELETRLEVDKYTGPTSEEMSEFTATEQTMRDETFTRIIMGQDTIDAFDRFVEDISAVGYSQIAKEVNGWYAEQKQ